MSRIWTLALLRRFTEFAESYPWSWTPGDVEDFTISLTSGETRLGPVDDPRLPPDVAAAVMLVSGTDWPIAVLRAGVEHPTSAFTVAGEIGADSSAHG